MAPPNELDEYIHMGEKPVEEDDLPIFRKNRKRPDEDTAIPTIERTPNSKRVEQEKYIPLKN
jgi:hypothetical protein